MNDLAVAERVEVGKRPLKLNAGVPGRGLEVMDSKRPKVLDVLLRHRPRSISRHVMARTRVATEAEGPPPMGVDGGPSRRIEIYASSTSRAIQLLRQPGGTPRLPHRLSVKEAEQRGDEKQDDLIYWTRDRQEGDPCDCSQRARDAPISSQHLARSDCSADKYPCAP